MDIKISKIRRENILLVDVVLSDTISKESFRKAEKYVLENFGQTFEKWNIKNLDWQDDPIIFDKFDEWIFDEQISMLNIDELIEKELTQEERDEFDLISIIDGEVDKKYSLSLMFIQRPKIKNDFDYKNIKLPKIFPETKEYYSEYLTKLFLMNYLISFTTSNILTSKHYGFFKYDLFIKNKNSNEYELKTQNQDVSTFYDFEILDKKNW